MLINYLEARAFASGSGTRLLSRLRRRFLYVTPRYLRYFSQTVVLTPWIMGLVSFYLLGFVPQMREIYIGIAEDREVLHGLLGLVTLCGFSALLYCWGYAMVTRRIDWIYPDHADIIFDRGVLGVRDLKTMISSALPFAGLFIGLMAAFDQARSAGYRIQVISSALGDGLDQTGVLRARLETLPGAILFCVTVALIACFGLIIALHRFRNVSLWRRRYEHACALLTVALVLAPILFSDLTLKASRFAGSLASTGLVLIAGAVFLRVLIWLATRILWTLLTLPSLLAFSMRGMPVVVKQLTVVLLPVLLIVLAGTKIEWLPAAEEIQHPVSILQELQERNGSAVTHRAELSGKFASWLRARGTGSGEYPIFIVTAEGGGIYAASAISFFLARMEERCPAFAEHIFAISGVSGGSVGASLFNAALAERGERKDVSRADGTSPGCVEPEQPGELFERLRMIMRDDHMSPVIAYVLPDLLRDIRELFTGAPPFREPCSNEVPFEWFGRDQMLEKSFIASFGQSEADRAKEKGAVTTVCPATAGASMLTRNFSDSWLPETKLPALLLNATWVETGYRVAFSPFSLQHLGEGTLYSFDDIGELPGRGHEAAQSWQDPSLIGAAAVSARFPFIMPPWVSNPSARTRWTFVDGGYADSSGATTGLELYRELKNELKDANELRDLTDIRGKLIDPKQIKLHLIVLSDAYAGPDINKITGSSLDDFISPFRTLLTVRELLARRAVTEAYAEAGEKNLIAIQLDQETFPLSLGWKISALSSDIIRFAMGHPDHCRPEKNNDPNRSYWTVNRNSCELKRIVELLTPKIPVSPKAPPPPAPAPAPVPSAPVIQKEPKTLGGWEPQPQ